MYQSGLHHRLQHLLTCLLILYVQASSLCHSVQLCEASEKSRNGGDEANEVQEIAEDGQDPSVGLVGLKRREGWQVDGHTVNEVHDVGAGEERDGEVDCRGMDWMPSEESEYRTYGAVCGIVDVESDLPTVAKLAQSHNLVNSLQGHVRAGSADVLELRNRKTLIQEWSY